MNLRTLLSALLLTTLLGAPQLQAKSKTNAFVKTHSAAIYDDLVDIQRDLNQHPEASGEEKRTSAIVAQYLRDLGLEVKTNVGGYGVVGVLQGAKEGKNIAWRADMDAARFEFGSEGKSDSDRPQAAHVCGHDIHTTIGLGIANVLSQRTDSLAGTVHFFFQPAEETATGARAMIDDGIFEKVDIDEIYGLHLAPSETGTIATKAGNLFSYQRLIKLSFDGADEAKELTEVVKTVMKSIQRVASNNEFMQLPNIIDPALGLANSSTIYQDYLTFYQLPQPNVLDNSVVFQTQLFSSDKRQLDRAVEQMKTLIEETKYKDRLLSLEHSEGLVGVDNDAKLANEVIETLGNYYGKQIVQKNHGQIPFFSEDFGMFQREVPGVFFFLGAGNTAFPHSPNFSADEKSIQVGVSYMSTLLLDRLSQ